MRVLLPLTVLLAACADSSLAAKSDAAADLEAAGAATGGALRIDVLPPGDIDGQRVLPQTLRVDGGAWEALPLELWPTRTLDGILHGTAVQVWPDLADLGDGPAAPIPTELVPIEATLAFTGPDGALGGAAVSDARTGAYHLETPAYPDAGTLRIVPSDGTLPFAVLPWDAASVAEDAADDAAATALDLPLGIPVWGRIHDAPGRPIGRASLRLSTEDATTWGTTFEAGPDGRFLARVAAPGRYILHLVGGPTPVDGPVVPALAVPVDVSTAETGANVDVNVGDVQTLVLRGAVEDAAGAPLENARVRLRSRSLEGAPGSLELERRTDGTGRFYAEVLPGRWDVEVLAPPTHTDSPVRLEDVEVSASATLGVLTLGRSERLSGIVRDPAGAPAGDVLLTATRAGWTGDTWVGRSDAGGRFSLTVPGGAYALTAQPADGAGARTSIEATTGLAVDLTLAEGAWVTGTVGLDGAPAAWSMLRIHDPVSDELLGIATADAEGAFALRLPTGTPAQ